jgi:hypothetical protein
MIEEKALCKDWLLNRALLEIGRLCIFKPIIMRPNNDYLCSHHLTEF